jgi:adenine-specific DNA-methyltransferase
MRAAGTPIPRSGTSPVRPGVPLNGNGAAPRSSEIRAGVLQRIQGYPQLRFMGSKYRLLPWIHDVLVRLPFDTALDAFSGSGCVAYLMKAMGKEVTANDFLEFTTVIARAAVENATETLDPETVAGLRARGERHHFIARTFAGIFYTPEDLRFLDRVWWNIQSLEDPHQRAVALAALIRACVKRQPRGVFTVAGDPQRYKDGRRDLKLSLEEHFVEQAVTYNAAVFDNGRKNRAMRSDVFDLDPEGYDLVYLDPPYVPRADDNCYIKRYHFLEGLACYWQGREILEESQVKKLRKRYTPFSYRRDAVDAFNRLFARFQRSILVLSYSSNGYPDLRVLARLMRQYKRNVRIHKISHRYHFGTHDAVRRDRVHEYLIVGT